MNLDGARILLTGAAGGIGRCLALALAERGARLALSGRAREPLQALAGELARRGREAAVLPLDLAAVSGHDALVSRAVAALGGLDVLVNNAGVSRFAPYVHMTAADIVHTVELNVTAPLLLAHAAARHFAAQGRGHIVNVGSALGSLGYPCFSAYSASKFALRGFSEALRRELSGAGVHVLYVAPRATATAMNGAAVRALYEQTGTAMDTPARVAGIIVEALERERSEVYIGWPERFFIALNAVFPRLVDRALARQARLAARHAAAATGESA